MPTINNYTVSDFTFSVTEGTEIYDTRQTVTLTLIPNPGFTLDANDFYRAAGPYPDGLADYEFVQSGNNVNLIMTFEEGFEMPSNNIDILLCVQGAAVERRFSVTTWIQNENENNIVFTPNPAKSYYNEGIAGETVTVLSFTAEAYPGWELDFPTPYMRLPNSNYSLTFDDIFDINGNHIERQCVITYTFPAEDYNPSVGENDLIIYNNAVEIFVEEQVVTAYTSPRNTAPSVGVHVAITIYGNPGATFSLERFDGTSSELLLDNFTLETNSYIYVAYLPAVTEQTENEFVFTGDLANTFDTATGQSSSFIITQYLPVTISVDAIGTGLEGYSEVSSTYEAYSIPISYSGQAFINVNWNITSTTGAALEIIRDIEESDFTNLKIYALELTSSSDNSTNIEVEDTSDLAEGMLINFGTVSSTISVVDIVDSTNVTVSEPVTLPEGYLLQFRSNNDNITELGGAMSLSEDGLTVDILLTFRIISYGSESIEFVLNLDNIIQEETLAPVCVEVNAEAGPIGGSVDYTDCSDNPISLVVAPNEITSPFFMLSGSATTTGDVEIILPTP
jgi:hypothetical protein